MSDSFDVVINGGGPVGLGLAIELGQRGIRVCVVERYPEPQPIPKGQNLTQRTSEHFRAWGCEDELHSAHPIPKGGGIGGMTAYGTLLSDHTYDWLNRSNVKDYYFAPNARLPQYATERVLRARAAEIPEITVLYGWSGDALELTDSGVRLTIAERNGDGRQVIEADYVVGCDGSRSFVREHAGISETLSDHNRMMALLVFRSEELHELLTRYPGKAFYNVLHPDYEGYWLFFGRVDHGLSWFFHAPVPYGTTAENFDFRCLLHKAVGQEFALEFDHIGHWDLRVSLADSYRAGRAFIAGDAAHSHPPMAATGSTPALRTRAIWAGNWPHGSKAGAVMHSSTATARNANRCSPQPHEISSRTSFAKTGNSSTTTARPQTRMRSRTLGKPVPKAVPGSRISNQITKARPSCREAVARRAPRVHTALSPARGITYPLPGQRDATWPTPWARILRCFAPIQTMQRHSPKPLTH